MTAEQGGPEIEALFDKYDPAKSSLKPDASIPFYIIKRHHDEFVSELRVMLAASVGGEVGKLEWTQDANGNWLASPLGFTYLILEWDRLCDLEVSVGGDDYVKIGNFDTLVKAKSAGQDDFNRRVATLVPSPLLREVEEALNNIVTYDAGPLNDYGGGNIEWWQDYIRAELGRADEFYRSQISAIVTKIEAAK